MNETMVQCLNPALCGVQKHRPGTLAQCRHNGARAFARDRSELTSAPSLASSGTSTAEDAQKLLRDDAYDVLGEYGHYPEMEDESWVDGMAERHGLDRDAARGVAKELIEAEAQERRRWEVNHAARVKKVRSETTGPVKRNQKVAINVEGYDRIVKVTALRGDTFHGETVDSEALFHQVYYDRLNKSDVLRPE